MSAWLLAAGCALCSAWLCRRFMDPASRLYLLDEPGQRSLHQRATPRTGGVAILLALLAAWWLGLAGNAAPFSPVSLWMTGGVLVLGTLGIWDDHSDLPPAARLPVQALVAVSVLLAGYPLRALSAAGFDLALSSPWSELFTLLFVLWMTNLYNFMDGMDGFAGGMAVIGFAALAWLGRDDAGYWFLALMVAAASAGFLCYNFPPARIFMGDAGAPVLGFLAAFFLLWADHAKLFPLWMGVLCFAPFVVDATYTLVRRAFRGEAVWRPHRSHLYQKLVLSGWSHRRTVLWSYLLMAACAVSAAWAQRAPGTVQLALLVFWGLFFAGLILAVERRVGAAA